MVGFGYIAVGQASNVIMSENISNIFVQVIYGFHFLHPFHTPASSHAFHEPDRWD